ncbi:ABC-type spermidine/putrescine transport system permease subunit I [Halarchaeum solikamskense]|uniref:ABC transporter permease n=1 Tax=Halarchaeum nitratireducens TaxID=489913 RepID=UPI001B3A9672|nr:ABC transporter permease [Halarchaeum solikamskense]MBP2252499.1 ABC-type spermidine/putrescine transport system permease subunit I [Halarchaeum solikamskense]
MSKRFRKGVSKRLTTMLGTYGGSRHAKWLLLAPALLVLVGLLYAPTVFILQESVRVGSHLGLTHYASVVVSGYYRSVALRTLGIGLLVTLLTFALGFPLAYAAVRGGRLLGGAIVVATLAPLSVDLVIRTYGWYILLGQGGPVPKLLVALGVGTVESPPQLLFNTAGIVVGLTHVLLPFMVFPIMTVLHTIPREYEEAARNLGANRLGVFAHVLLPLALPGIAAGMLLVFTNSIAAYVTPAILGGSTQTLATEITSIFTTTNDWGLGSALAVLLVAVAVCIIVGYQRAMEAAGGAIGGTGGER